MLFHYKGIGFGFPNPRTPIFLYTPPMYELKGILTTIIDGIPYRRHRKELRRPARRQPLDTSS